MAQAADIAGGAYRFEATDRPGEPSPRGV